jgi:hypothetical protein
MVLPDSEYETSIRPSLASRISEKNAETKLVLVEEFIVEFKDKERDHAQQGQTSKAD